MRRLIVTNGGAAVARLRAAGIADDILAWDDMLHDGPVPGGLALEELSQVRARFIAEDLGLATGEVRAQFARRDETIRRHSEYEAVELWFEHDLYDQLQLVQLLEFLAGENRRDGVLLVQADDYLGLQDTDAIAALAAAARPVRRDEMDRARQAWGAFTAADPQALTEIGDDDILPFLGPALRRLLAEYPAPETGLSLTECRILKRLGDGPVAVGQLFQWVSEQDAARFLADAPFFRRLDALAFTATALVSGLPYPSPRCAGGPDGPDYRVYARAHVGITEAGAAARAGRFDHAGENGIDRWIGGTHLRPGNFWRWEPTRRELIAPG